MFVLLSVLLLLVISTYLDVRIKKVSIRLLAIFSFLYILIFLMQKLLSVKVIDNQSLPLVAGGIAVGVFVILLAKVTRNGIGTGDGMLLCVTGLYLGIERNLRMFITALSLAAVVSIGLLLARKVKRKTAIPFVPFLLSAYLIELFMEVIR